MDFFDIREKGTKDGILIYPEFKYSKSKDLMIRGKSFYAVWNKHTGMWSTDEYDVQSLVDEELWDFKNNNSHIPERSVVQTLKGFDSGLYSKYKTFLKNSSDNYNQLNSEVIFNNTVTSRTSYCSHKLPYSLEAGSITAYDEMMSVIYSEEERQKLEWAIGSIITGDSKKIQKFIVLFGEGGTGKSTFLNILEMLFEGYYTHFDAKALTGSNNQFSTETFKNDPLLAIQHDGDLSKIEDNSKLNSIVSHETISVNEKFKSQYEMKMNAFLFLASNKPVQITDSKSGIIRRLIDVKPTGKVHDADTYYRLMDQIPFELGAIAYHCKEVYLKLGKKYYNSYQAKDMMLQTNVFYNFIQENYFIFKEANCTTLNQAYEMYKNFIDDSGCAFKLAKYKVREELKAYFKKFESFGHPDGKTVRDYYEGFLFEKVDGINMKEETAVKPDYHFPESDASALDILFGDYPAQYANEQEAPCYKWENVKTKLKDISSKQLHYVKLPPEHIVIDFDLKDEKGEKSLELNLEAMSRFPTTYAEYSKSGQGIHLHYIYDGDVSELSSLYSKDIEIKVFKGNASLRRKFTKSNGETISHISAGLPLRKEKKMTNESQIKSEQGLRRMIERNLNKEIHPATKPSIDFIFKILEDAYNSDMVYDVTDMKPKMLNFAMGSTNNKDYCIDVVNKMKCASKEVSTSTDDNPGDIVFFDCEVFPNLLLICYKIAGEGHDVVKMLNPSAIDIEQLFKMKLVGFNNRKYDNHILYGRFLGLDNEAIYKLSQKLIMEKGGQYTEAYNLSYTDIYDFSTDKKSLKKWEIELGIFHDELEYPWDEPIPESQWERVAEYCGNDVIATEKVFYHLEEDWDCRQILADISGGSVNDTTNQLSTRLIFGDDKHPELVYTDLATGEIVE